MLIFKNLLDGVNSWLYNSGEKISKYYDTTIEIIKK